MARSEDVAGYLHRFAALAGLVVSAPLAGAIAFVVGSKLGSPVLFRQRRTGTGGTDFELVKFRTMSDERGPDGELLDDEHRLGSLGRTLRSTSLDEIPTLFNVVRGEMSLVGPRPLLPEYWDLYTDEQRRRCDVPPGITGWAQVHGRNALSWEEKFELDVWYVDNRSIWLDIRILAMTVLAVARRTGVAADGAATAHRFTGSSTP